jgi:hypothetical protein
MENSMSEAAKAARSAMKDKIKRLLMPNKGKVDASDYGPEEVLDAGVKTGMRPISRRAFKAGGKVDGEAAPARADRKPRTGNKATTPNSMINRNVKDANEEREGKKHIGGFARGGNPEKFEGSARDEREDKKLAKKHGMSKEAWERSAMDDKHDSQRSMKGLKSGGAPHKAGGGMLDDDMPQREPMRSSRMPSDDGPRYNRGAVDNMIKGSRQKIGGREAKMIHALLKGRQGSEYARGGAPKATDVSDGKYEGTRPTGGRLARASGGKTGKGKMNVNIIISTGPKGQGPQPGMPGGPLGSPPGGLIAAPPPPSAPPPAMPPPPMPPGGPPGAMGGAPMGGMPPMARKFGGRTSHGVHRTYKDMDAGAGSGPGRLEKTEIQKHKK